MIIPTMINNAVRIIKKVTKKKYEIPMFEPPGCFTYDFDDDDDEEDEEEEEGVYDGVMLISNFELYGAVFAKILFTIIWGILFIYPTTVQQLLQDNTIIYPVLFSSFAAVILIVCLKADLWISSKLLGFLIVLMILCVCGCSVVPIYMPNISYEIIVIAGLGIFLTCLQLTWPIYLSKISTYSISVVCCADGLWVILWNIAYIIYPKFGIIFFYVVHISLLYSFFYLVIHFYLIIHFKEKHFLSNTTLICNIINILFKLQLSIILYLKYRT